MDDLQELGYIAIAPFDSSTQRVGEALGERLEKAPVDLGNGVSLRKMPDWIRETEALGKLNAYQRHWVGSATHCLLGSVASPQGLEGDMAMLRRLLDANLALWIAHPCGWGFDILLFFEGDRNRWIDRSSYGHPKLIAHKENAYESLEFEHVCEAKVLNLAIMNLNPETIIGIAKAFLQKALHEPDFPVRYLLLWIGLEALFGADVEVSHRLSLRTAMFLGSNREEARNFYLKARGCYSWRSKIVHGAPLTKLTEKKSDRVLFDSEQMLREALLKILPNEDHRIQFNGRERQAFLDELVFARLS